MEQEGRRRAGAVEAPLPPTVHAPGWDHVNGPRPPRCTTNKQPPLSQEATGATPPHAHFRCGVVVRHPHLLGTAGHPVVRHCRAPRQQHHGIHGAPNCIKVRKPALGHGCILGDGQGGVEVGYGRREEDSTGAQRWIIEVGAVVCCGVLWCAVVRCGESGAPLGSADLRGPGNGSNCRAGSELGASHQASSNLHPCAFACTQPNAAPAPLHRLAIPARLPGRQYVQRRGAGTA